MSSEDDLARLKSGLAEVERENADRMSLIDRRAAKSMEESKESGDKLRKETSLVVASLAERNQRAKAAGGWATESSLADKAEDDDFGFEEDEEENERRAGYKVADPLDVPLPAAQRQVPPPPPPVAPPPEPARPAGRHRSRGQQDEEDDYANTDWLEG